MTLPACTCRSDPTKSLTHAPEISICRSLSLVAVCPNHRIEIASSHLLTYSFAPIQIRRLNTTTQKENIQTYTRPLQASCRLVTRYKILSDIASKSHIPFRTRIPFRTKRFHSDSSLAYVPSSISQCSLPLVRAALSQAGGCHPPIRLACFIYSPE